MKVKVYVPVRAQADEAGLITPEGLTVDGNALVIDRVLERREARQTKQGGRGVRYLVRAGHWEAYLYRDEDRRWYLEEDEHVRQIPCFDGG
ncbi:MAG TPA: hypothetical protein PLR12_07355 [Clostridia bacterium]|mgnify:FL=1|nr:hypothetical protein [Clostridia bacterium]